MTEESLNELIINLSEALPDVNVRLQKIIKNNDVEKIAIGLSEDSLLEKLVYPEDFMESSEQTVQDIVDAYNNYKRDEIKSIINTVNDYDKIKDRIIFSLVSYNLNTKFLEDKVYEQYLDLAIIYKVMLDVWDKKEVNINVTTKLLDSWGVSASEVKEQAEKNTQELLPVYIRNMQEWLTSMGCLDIDGSVDMFVFSNKYLVGGASTMVYNDMLWNFAKMQNSDLYIIPCSINEIIVFPIEDALETDEIKMMIGTVNRTNVLDTEVLSYSLYHISKETGEISIV